MKRKRSLQNESGDNRSIHPTTLVTTEKDSVLVSTQEVSYSFFLLISVLRMMLTWTPAVWRWKIFTNLSTSAFDHVCRSLTTSSISSLSSFHTAPISFYTVVSGLSTSFLQANMSSTSNISDFAQYLIQGHAKSIPVTPYELHLSLRIWLKNFTQQTFIHGIKVWILVLHISLAICS
jgi:hypothetical protein